MAEQTKEESEKRAAARIALSPSLQSALTLKDSGKFFENMELTSIVRELKHQVEQSVDGNLDRARDLGFRIATETIGWIVKYPDQPHYTRGNK